MLCVGGSELDAIQVSFFFKYSKNLYKSIHESSLLFFLVVWLLEEKSSIENIPLT